MIVRNGVQPWRLLTCSAVHKWSPLSNNTFLFLFNPDLAYMLLGITATGPSLWAGFAFDCSIIMLENQLVNSTSSPLYRFQLNVITCTITHTIVSVSFDVIWSALGYLGQFVLSTQCFQILCKCLNWSLCSKNETQPAASTYAFYLPAQFVCLCTCLVPHLPGEGC